MTYARNTTVGAMRTRNEIEETLERYGADGFAYATQGNLATVIFAMENRRIRFVLELPDADDFRHTNHSPPQERGQRAQQDAYDQACRQRWRALLPFVPSTRMAGICHIGGHDRVVAAPQEARSTR